MKRDYCRYLTYNGRTAPIQDWADSIGISYQALTYRLKVGWPVAKAVTTPRLWVTTPRSSVKRKPVAPVTTPPQPLMNEYRAIQRHFNSILRQFNRDLHTIMGRSLARGVVADLSKSANDRSIPVARDRV